MDKERKKDRRIKRSASCRHASDTEGGHIPVREDEGLRGSLSCERIDSDGRRVEGHRREEGGERGRGGSDSFRNPC